MRDLLTNPKNINVPLNVEKRFLFVAVVPLDLRHKENSELFHPKRTKTEKWSDFAKVTGIPKSWLGTACGIFVGLYCAH